MSDSSYDIFSMLGDAVHRCKELYGVDPECIVLGVDEWREFRAQSMNEFFSCTDVFDSNGECEVEFKGIRVLRATRQNWLGVCLPLKM